MENELFASMRAQLCPSGGAKSALQDKLEQITAPRRRRPMWGGLAAAACAVFAISLYYTLPFMAEGRLHSYITLEDGDPAAVKKEYQQETTAQGLDKGGEEEEEPNTLSSWGPMPISCSWITLAAPGPTGTAGPILPIEVP